MQVFSMRGRKISERNFNLLTFIFVVTLSWSSFFSVIHRLGCFSVQQRHFACLFICYEMTRNRIQTQVHVIHCFVSKTHFRFDFHSEGSGEYFMNTAKFLDFVEKSGYL